MLIGQISRKRVVLDCVSGDPSQRRFFRFTIERLDVNPQGLIWPEVERLVWHDDLAVEMCGDRHVGAFPFSIAGTETSSNTADALL